MHISWLGQTTIKIQTRPMDIDVTLVINPYKPARGNFPRSLSPDLGLFTEGQENSITLSGNPFILATSGECETKGVLVTAVQGHKENQTMLRIDSEQLSIAHLGITNKPLTDAQLGVLSGVDILIIPVGNSPLYFDPETAVKMVNEIEPRIVIPVGYKSDNEPSAKPVEDFLKEIGTPKVQTEKKLIIKKKSLPEEEMQVVVLEKE